MEPNARIFVAGHRGMVGSALVRCLKASGFTDIVTRRMRSSTCSTASRWIAFCANSHTRYIFIAAAKVGGILANNQYRVQRG